jgi:hypothetical protein
MHPADECEAFRDLGDKGMPAADIAARFGVTEAVVNKRLKLSRFSPVIIAAYRAGKLDLEQVMAFAISDDYKAQGYFPVPVSGSRPSETRTSHAREPREMSCPAFRAIETPPARKRAHRSHTSAVEIRNYWDLKGCY